MKDDSRWQWIGPLASLLIFCAVVYVLRRELAHIHLRDVIAQLHAIPNTRILIALALAAVNYGVLSGYDSLALRYLDKRIRYPKILKTSFIAYAFGHTLGFSALTGAAVRFRLYSPLGLNAAQIAAMAAFCSLTAGLGLTTLTSLSLILEPQQAVAVLHWGSVVARAAGAVLSSTVVAYFLCCLLIPTRIDIFRWHLRTPPAPIALLQIGLAVIDLSLAASILWCLLPSQANISFVAFVGIYAAAIAAGIVSHVPGGIGVFEAVIVLALPQVPVSSLLGAILVFRVAYYLLPLLIAAPLFASSEIGRRNAKAAMAATAGTKLPRSKNPD